MKVFTVTASAAGYDSAAVVVRATTRAAALKAGKPAAITKWCERNDVGRDSAGFLSFTIYQWSQEDADKRAADHAIN